jgi:hypothetical protein
MSSRAAELFSSAEPDYEKDKEPVQEEDFNPLQLENMLGYAGEYNKTILALPGNENVIVKRYDDVALYITIIYRFYMFSTIVSVRWCL